MIREYAAATGLGGRDRRMDSDAERARVNVTRAIHSVLARIDAHHPALGRHLKQTVRTGTFSSTPPTHAPLWTGHCETSQNNRPIQQCGARIQRLGENPEGS